MLPFVVCGPGDGNVLIVLSDMLHETAEGVPQEEAGREPGGVGSQTEHIEMLVRIEPAAVPVSASAVGDPIQHIPEIGLGDSIGGAGGGEQGALVGAAAVLRPAHHRGIADGLTVLPVGQQGVEGGGVSKGGALTDRRVGILLMAIRAERRSVEGDQCGTGGLGAGYAF